MDLNALRDRPHFSFLYGGSVCNGYGEGIARSVAPRAPRNPDAESWTLTYALPDGLSVTEELDLYPAYQAARWVLRFRNGSKSNSAQISQVWDCDVTAPLNLDYLGKTAGHVPPPIRGARVYRTVGSNWARDEYSACEDYVRPGAELAYACIEGRSAQGLAPYFELNQYDSGLLLAIGWSGQWNARFTGTEGGVGVRTGIEALDLYLEPGEEIRTSSVLLMWYDNGSDEGHVKFRRLFKKHFSLIGKPGRPDHGPLAMTTWGSLLSHKMIERIKAVSEQKLGFDTYWIDAGWYGHSTDPCVNEHLGDWGSHTGSWNINSQYHPDGLEQVSAAAREAGMDMLLWIEPERVLRDTDTPRSHPEWFLNLGDDNATWLLNLGNPEALRGTYEMIAGLIEKLRLKCYRQDFNTNPLPYWRRADTEGRRGITEIRHIEGLYRLWDMLLERFPDMYIDNCASGGRRNDIELLSRSMPLWRSDYQCWFDADSETTQIHNTGISRWIPYHGSGVGTYFGDAYHIRSAYSPSMTVPYWMYDQQDINGTEPFEFLRGIFAEYISVRPYLSCDYYPLMQNSLCDTSWCAWQYNRPEQGDGIIQVFRRPKSPHTTAKFSLRGLDPSASYIITVDDTGETITATGASLAAGGLELTIPAPRESRLLRYSRA